MENKIIIKIVGGLVECVYSNLALDKLDIEVLDEDVVDDDYEDERVYLREEAEKLIAHHC